MLRRPILALCALLAPTLALGQVSLSPRYNAVTTGKVTVTGPGSTGPIDGMTVGGTAVSTILGLKAPLASPAFTGTVTAPAFIGDLSGASVMALGGTSRPNALRAIDAINSRDFGAICDGLTRPISGLSTFNGANVSGWTLAQWQAVYPFVTALTNEADQVAIVAAQNFALAKGKTLRVAAGLCLTNFTAAIYPSVGQSVSVSGDGPATQIAVSGAVTPLAYTMPNNPSSPAGEVSFRDFTAYQSQAILGGSAFSVAGPATGSGSPVVNVTNVAFGRSDMPVNTGGTFSVAVLLQDVVRSHFVNPKFYGAINYSLGGPNGRNGIGVKSNGNVNKLSFGPYLINPEFDAMNIGVQIGDGTNAYVQGVKLIGGSTVGSNQTVKWYGQAGQSNDYLSILNHDFQDYGVAIDTDNVLTVDIHSNYSISNGSDIIASLKTSGNIAQAFNVSGNNFVGYGRNAAVGVEFSASTGQKSNTIGGNNFFVFNGTGSVPVRLLSGTSGTTVSGNSFGESNVSTDAGTNNWTNNTTRTSAGESILYATGIPLVDPRQPGSSAAGVAVTINRAPVADQAKNLTAPLTGDTHVAANSTSWQVYNPAGTLASLTTTMPSNPVDGQEITFTSSQTITAWAVQGNTGQSVQGAPSSLGSGNSVTFRWNKTFSAWQTKNSLSSVAITGGSIAGTRIAPISGLIIPNGEVVLNSTASFNTTYLNKYITFGGSATSTFTLTSANAVSAGDTFLIRNAGSALLTIVAPGGSGLANSPVVLRPGDTVAVFSNGGTIWNPLFLPRIPLVATSASLGGSALAAGASSSVTVPVTGLAVGMSVQATPTTYPGDGFVWSAYVSAVNEATVRVTALAAGTPAATTYNVRAIQ